MLETTIESRLICHGNRTEWSTIRGVIGSKLCSATLKNTICEKLSGPTVKYHSLYLFYISFLGLILHFTAPLEPAELPSLAQEDSFNLILFLHFRLGLILLFPRPLEPAELCSLSEADSSNFPALRATNQIIFIRITIRNHHDTLIATFVRKIV